MSAIADFLIHSQCLRAKYLTEDCLLHQAALQSKQGSQQEAQAIAQPAKPTPAISLKKFAVLKPRPAAPKELTFPTMPDSPEHLESAESPELFE